MPYRVSESFNLTQASGTLGIFTLSLLEELHASIRPRIEPRFHQILVTYTDINMDTTRDLYQIGQKGLRVPTSPELDDELFHSFFDWQGYCAHTQPSSADIASSSPYPPSHSIPRDLPKLITEIPSLINDYSLESLGNDFIRMSTSYSPNEVYTTSDYSGHTPPELVRGGSTSPSDHSGSIYLERVDRPEVSLQEVQAQDDEWTYPQTLPSKHAPRGYPPRLQVQEDLARREYAAGLKRRRSGNGLDKRQRQLSDPMQTADVRKSGACLPCRLSKTRVRQNRSPPNMKHKLSLV